MDSLDKVFQDFLHSPFVKSLADKMIIEEEEIFLTCQYYYNSLQLDRKKFTNPKHLSAFLVKNAGSFAEDNLMSVVDVFFILEHLYRFAYESKVISQQEFATMVETILMNTVEVIANFEDVDDWEDEVDVETLTSAFGQFLEEELGKGKKSKKNNVIPMNGKKNASAVYQFRIDLAGFKPPIWRRVLVPSNLTFDQFHLVIQNLFEWQNYHLYDFRFGNTIIEVPSEEESFFDIFSNRESLDSFDERIGEWFAQEGDRCTYTYDFGDDWEHTIKLEKVFYPNSPEYEQGKRPVCTKLKGDAPAEDSRFEEIFLASDLSNVNERLTQLKL